MEYEPTAIPGCSVVRSGTMLDDRGSFLKLYHEPSFAADGRAVVWREVYLSQSRRCVIRGMHLQTPPEDHDKLVFCLAGEVLDVVVDLRIGSPSRGEHIKVPLRPDGAGLFIPRGCAHGFLSVSDQSSMLYLVTTAHAPLSDGGIRWDSFGCDWGVEQPIVSSRDAGLPALAAFQSPFHFEAPR